MKRAMTYILALTMVFSLMLSGCGVNRTETTAPTQKPETTILPETMMPDPDDGIVRDDDGVITDDDTGEEPIGDTDAQENGTLQDEQQESRTDGMARQR